MPEVSWDVRFDFTGKNFVVTGASSGMGRQVAIELSNAGAKVFALGRDAERLQQLHHEQPSINVAVCDVLDYEFMEICIKDFVAKEGKLDGCVHAAGIAGFTPLRSYDELLAKKIMDVSFWAGMKLVQLCTKVSIANKATSNILFSSVSGNCGEKGMFAYSSAKAAMKVAIKSFAKELAEKKHRLNVISPGFVATNMTENTVISEELLNKYLLGLGEPADISGMMLFLLSNRARWITGTDIIIDGGYLSS